MKTNLKLKIFLTVAFLVSLLPMSAIQYGIPGINGRTGWINLYNPVGIVATLIFILGLWVPLHKLKNVTHPAKTSYAFGLIGVVGIVISEILTFLIADSPNSYISLSHSFEYAEPYFFLGLFVSIMMVVIYCSAMSLAHPRQNKPAKKSKKA